MINISHRGLIDGPNKRLENTIKAVDFALDIKLDVEIDVRLVNKRFYLGHDSIQEEVTIDWLLVRKKQLWVHCKDLDSADFFTSSNIDLNFFFHQNDDLCITSKGFLWIYPKKKFTKNSIIVCTSANEIKKIQYEKQIPKGICSDYPQLIKKIYT